MVPRESFHVYLMEALKRRAFSIKTDVAKLDLGLNGLPKG
jgi:hypothetical protein